MQQPMRFGVSTRVTCLVAKSPAPIHDDLFHCVILHMDRLTLGRAACESVLKLVSMVVTVVEERRCLEVIDFYPFGKDVEHSDK